jgi:hypothetical protein
MYNWPKLTASSLELDPLPLGPCHLDLAPQGSGPTPGPTAGDLRRS